MSHDLYHILLVQSKSQIGPSKKKPENCLRPGGKGIGNHVALVLVNILNLASNLQVISVNFFWLPSLLVQCCASSIIKMGHGAGITNNYRAMVIINGISLW